MKRPFKEHLNGFMSVVVFSALLLPTGVQAGPTLDPWLLEQKKSFTKTYSVSPKDRLFISNQYGDVRVQLWDKPEVRAEIQITASGNSPEEIQQILDKVQIQEEHPGDLIRFVTQYDARQPSPNAWAWTDWGNRRSNEGTPHSVRIQYTILMPRSMPLELRNRFGNVTIPDFSAPLTVQCDYGTVSTGYLHGQQTLIQVNYGKANIKALDKGRLAIEHSRLVLGRAGDLQLDNKHGNLQIREVDRLDAELSYSTGQIEALKESARMQLRYLSNFRLPALPQGVKTVEINSECSDLRMPVNSTTNVDFDITVNYADFRAPDDQIISFTRNDDRRSPPPRPQKPNSSQKTYIGKLGKGGGTLKITSNYGTVKFED